MSTNKIIIIFLLMITSYFIWIYYDSCFKQIKHLSIKYQNSQTEEVNLDTQLENCEKRKAQFIKWIKENQDRINQKKEKLLKCTNEVEKLEIELNRLKKIKGGV